MAYMYFEIKYKTIYDIKYERYMYAIYAMYIYENGKEVK